MGETIDFPCFIILHTLSEGEIGQSLKSTQKVYILVPLKYTNRLSCS